MALKETIKGFLGLSGTYAAAAQYLAEHGYDDRYIEILDETIQGAGKKKAAEGMALKAQGLLFKGDLAASAEVFSQTEARAVPKDIASIFVNNYSLCLFLLDRFSEVKTVYEEYNDIALKGDSLQMRRTIGISEHISHRYENAVTVFVKLLSYPDPRATLMADICIVKTFLRLDMTARAKEIADKSFDRYNAHGELTAQVNKLRSKITAPKNKKRTNRRG